VEIYVNGVRLLGNLTRWVQNIFTDKSMTSSQFKINKKLLEELILKLHQEFYILDLKKMISLQDQDDIRIYKEDIRINNFSNYKKEIKIFLSLPSAKITQKWDALNELWIEFDYKTYDLEFDNDLTKSRNNTITKLKEMQYLYKNNPNDNFLMLYAKYEDTFITLIETMKEIKNISKLTTEQSKTIFQVLDTIIQEFDSLVKLNKKLINSTDSAVKISLTNRLKDELELVNKIKTDWNANRV
jgi:hypothetical protein